MGDFLSDLGASLGLSTLNDKLKPYFKYRTPKYILVEVPLVGIIHRVCQILALIYVVITMVTKSTWALATVPLGSTNPWVEDGQPGQPGYAKIGETYTSDSAGFPYCSNPTYAYNYGDDWLYGTKDAPPICSSPNRHTISQKTADSVFVTTAYIESSEHGFACTEVNDTVTADQATAADQTTSTEKCGAGATLVKYASGQCVCTSETKTYFPLAAEKMAVSFQHFYGTPTLASSQQISGGSDKADAENPLKTTFVMANGTEMKWDPPQTITIPLHDLLLGAEHASCPSGSPADRRDGKDDGKCATGITLDEPNVDVKPEETVDDTGPHYPRFRTTGASVELEIKYTNTENERAQAGNHEKVKATITAIVQTGAWSSVGAQVYYNKYPTVAAGQPADSTVKDWWLSSRYKQGIMVSMKSTGVVYTFDIVYLVQALVTGLVLLKAANTIADFVAFNLLPGGQSTVLANKRAETVSKKSEFAEMGLKAALAAFQFGFFDRDHNGTVEAMDICRAFANLEGPKGKPVVEPEQAHAIATAIMSDADTDQESFGALDFSEFMTCIDGDSIAFNNFLTKLKLCSDQPDYQDCLNAYNQQRAKVDKEKDARTVIRKPYNERHPSMASVIRKI
jgi:hypothetical protein